MHRGFAVAVSGPWPRSLFRLLIINECDGITQLYMCWCTIALLQLAMSNRFRDNYIITQMVHGEVAQVLKTLYGNSRPNLAVDCRR
jgi:hypothetical protein